MKTTFGRDHKGNVIRGPVGPQNNGLGNALEYDPSELPRINVLYTLLAPDPWIQLEPNMKHMKPYETFARPVLDMACAGAFKVIPKAWDALKEPPHPFQDRNKEKS